MKAIFEVIGEVLQIGFIAESTKNVKTVQTLVN